jgi:hypothetical protein
VDAEQLCGHGEISGSVGKAKEWSGHENNQAGEAASDEWSDVKWLTMKIGNRWPIKAARLPGTQAS